MNFLKRIVAERIQRKDKYAYENNGKPCRGKYKYEVTEYAPPRVYKDAERRGDTAVMERSMRYVGEFADKAEDYQKKAEKGMEEDAKKAGEKAKTEQKNAIQKRKEMEKRITESRNGDISAMPDADIKKA